MVYMRDNESTGGSTSLKGTNKVFTGELISLQEGQKFYRGARNSTEGPEYSTGGPKILQEGQQVGPTIFFYNSSTNSHTKRFLLT